MMCISFLELIRVPAIALLAGRHRIDLRHNTLIQSGNRNGASSRVPSLANSPEQGPMTNQAALSDRVASTLSPRFVDSRQRADTPAYPSLVLERTDNLCHPFKKLNSALK